jgi:NAD(P)-dependent dehydrogenase (short-subunit alcohol dehydrogenase family)
MSAAYPSLASKRVLVTGGASGIGAAMVEAFARQGAQVAFVDVDGEAGSALARSLAPGAAHAPAFHEADLTDPDALEAMLARVEAGLGGVDVLVNNAGSDDRHALDEVTPAYWDGRMAVNLRHMFFCAQGVAAGMRARGGGVILNLGSVSWHLGLEGLVAYQTAKAAVEGLTRGLARELGPAGVRVNTIVPGNVQTPRQQRWYTPEGEAEIVAAQCLKQRVQPNDVAAMALFLASDGARMCTGHNYWVDAGWR